jgi:uncharacterized low-complexity protein
MNLLKKSALTAIMGVLAISVFASNVAKAETNPFATQDLVTFVAEEMTADKCGESKAKAKGKCGEGKCGETKANAKGKCGEGKEKCGEGKSKKCGG